MQARFNPGKPARREYVFRKIKFYCRNRKNCPGLEAGKITKLVPLLDVTGAPTSDQPPGWTNAGFDSRTYEPAAEGQEMNTLFPERSMFGDTGNTVLNTSGAKSTPRKTRLLP